MNDSIFNPEPELAILSILLKTPAKFDELRILKPFMFSVSANKELYSIIVDINRNSLVADPSLLESNLKASGKMGSIGGTGYIEHILSKSFDENNLKEFERLVVNSYKARTLISIASSIPGKITSTEDIDPIINVVKSSLEKLTISSGGDSTVYMGDILPSTLEDISYRIKNPGIQGKTSGFKNFDLVSAGLCSGDLWFVAGRPGSGKTSCMLNMAYRMATSGVKILIFSLEMKTQQLVERMISMCTGIPIINLRTGLLTAKQLDQIKSSIVSLKELPIYIDSNYYATVGYYESTLRKYHKQFGIDVSFMDNINLMSERSTDATNELGRISRIGKILANDLGITNIILAQLNRNVELRDDKRPRLSDLRQSGNLEEDADVVIGLYRDVYYNREVSDKSSMEAIFLKQRSGPTGTVPMTFYEDTNKMEDR